MTVKKSLFGSDPKSSRMRKWRRTERRNSLAWNRKSFNCFQGLFYHLIIFRYHLSCRCHAHSILETTGTCVVLQRQQIKIIKTAQQPKLQVILWAPDWVHHDTRGSSLSAYDIVIAERFTRDSIFTFRHSDIFLMEHSWHKKVFIYAIWCTSANYD